MDHLNEIIREKSPTVLNICSPNSFVKLNPADFHIMYLCNYSFSSVT